MHVLLIIVGCVVLAWIGLVYSTFYWPSCIHTLRYFAGTLIVIWALNFVGFCVGSLIIGGDATGNPPENGRYYVSEHGRRTEVSHQVYEYSCFHAKSVWVTSPLLLLGLFILYDEDEKHKKNIAA